MSGDFYRRIGDKWECFELTPPQRTPARGEECFFSVDPVSGDFCRGIGDEGERFELTPPQRHLLV